MRIHWAFVVLAVIGTILLTWYLRTSDMDFLTPSGNEIVKTEEAPNFVDPSAVLQPEIKDQPPISPKKAGKPKNVAKILKRYIKNALASG
mgnify:CR=1 FL=1